MIFYVEKLVSPSKWNIEKRNWGGNTFSTGQANIEYFQSRIGVVCQTRWSGKTYERTFLSRTVVKGSNECRVKSHELKVRLKKNHQNTYLSNSYMLMTESAISIAVTPSFPWHERMKSLYCLWRVTRIVSTL